MSYRFNNVVDGIVLCVVRGLSIVLGAFLALFGYLGLKVWLSGVPGEPGDPVSVGDYLYVLTLGVMLIVTGVFVRRGTAWMYAAIICAWLVVPGFISATKSIW